MSDKLPPSGPAVTQQLNSTSTTGTPLNQVVWDLDRSDPLQTLKSMIRERMSPAVLSGLRVQAMVVSVDAGIPPIVETVYGDSGGEKSFQMVRVRGVSDARHYWLPEVQNPEDPVAGFYPVIKHDISKSGGNTLQWGQFIEVQFYNNSTQFTSHMEVGDTVSLLPSSYLSEYKTSYSDQTKVGFVGANCSVRTEQVTQDIGMDDQGQAITETVVLQKVEGCGKIEQLKTYNAPVEETIAPGQKVDLFWPSPNKKVTSEWNPARTIDGETRPHKGVDIRAPWGTPIFAALDGKVTHRIQGGNQPGKGFGYYVILSSGTYALKPGGDPVQVGTLYAHMQNPSITPIVSNGANVKKGQIIGISAASGKNKPAGPPGAHLHFEIIIDGVKKDPLPFLKNGLYKAGGGAT